MSKQNSDKEYCVWKTSRSEIDDIAGRLRKEGEDIPDELDYEDIVRRYKKGVEWGFDGHWMDIIQDSIRDSVSE